MLAENNISEARNQKELDAAKAIIEYWKGEKLSLVAENSLHDQGNRLTQNVLDLYRQGAIQLEKAVALMEAALGKYHPDLRIPRAGFAGVVSTIDEARGQRIRNHLMSQTSSSRTP